VRRILLVDDEPLILDVLGTVLVDEGYRVETAPDGRAALDLVEAGLPDLIISDVMMPRLSGLDLLAQVRPRSPTLPVILLSAMHQWRQPRERADSDHTVFLAKPFDLEELLEIVVRLIKP
jgi:two-component system response regulator MprA